MFSLLLCSCSTVSLYTSYSALCYLPQIMLQRCSSAMIYQPIYFQHYVKMECIICSLDVSMLFSMALRKYCPLDPGGVFGAGEL